MISSVNVVLLGDSVFDNGAYVGRGQPDVAGQIRALLPAGATATLRAVDGATTDAVARQLAGLPRDATHLVLSAGGNDAIGYLDVLDAASRTVSDALERLSGLQADFSDRYARLLDAVDSARLPTVVCTIYEPRFPDRRLQRLAVTGLSLLNDVILRHAIRRGIAAIDLREVCTEDADFANPIEPSVTGGGKIATVIVRAVNEHDFGRRRCQVFGAERSMP